MSTNRVRRNRGYANPKSLPKGPNGRNLCRQCGKEVEPPRQTFCGDECVHQWKLRTSPQYLRDHTFKRDKGICRSCGFYCHEADQAVQQVIRLMEQKLGQFACGPAVKAMLEAVGRGGRASFWEADHIVPVAKGGGECGLENIQTLCVFCHAKKTKEQATKSGE